MRYIVVMMLLLILADSWNNASASGLGPSAESPVLPVNGFRAADVLKELDQLQSEAQIRRALSGYELQLRGNPDSPEILVKAAYLAYRLGWLFASGEERKNLYLRSFEYARQASGIVPGEYHVLLLLTVAKAKVVDYFPVGDQVRMAREMAADAEQLVRRRADDPDSLYLLSWLNFEIGRVSSINRMLAATFFGGLPEGLSVENAFSLLESAIRYRPDYVVYQYDLGYYHLRTGDRDKARKQFRQILAVEPRSAEERIYQQRAVNKMRELEAFVN